MAFRFHAGAAANTAVTSITQGGNRAGRTVLVIAAAWIGLRDVLPQAMPRAKKAPRHEEAGRQRSRRDGGKVTPA